jgi:hypothetical protein
MVFKELSAVFFDVSGEETSFGSECFFGLSKSRTLERFLRQLAPVSRSGQVRSVLVFWFSVLSEL